jgi:glycosyltransferase involved in cell wall biosynthesis
VNLSWFILGYSYLAVRTSKLMGKKSILLAGGWDVAKIPELDYGYTLDPKRAKRLRYCLANASRVITISNFLRDRILELSPDADIPVIPLGFDPEVYKPKGKKKNMVITAVGMVNFETIKLKGLDTFVKTAASFQDSEFVVIGNYDKTDKHYAKLIKSAPPNVKFTGWLEFSELLGYFQEARVYMQLSAIESFGSALAESMLCGCVPVVSERGAMPEVVGDTGFYVPFKDTEKTAAALRSALDSDKGKAARERIISRYPLKTREKLLVDLINNVTSKR